MLYEILSQPVPEAPADAPAALFLQKFKLAAKKARKAKKWYSEPRKSDLRSEILTSES
jgi:hypothetical protein